MSGSPAHRHREVGAREPDAPSLRLLQKASGARRRVEGLPYGLLKGKALRGGKPLGEVFGFLRQINCGNNLAQTAVNA
jgi:hypothetical protein